MHTENIEQSLDFALWLMLKALYNLGGAEGAVEKFRQNDQGRGCRARDLEAALGAVDLALVWAVRSQLHYGPAYALDCYREELRKAIAAESTEEENHAGKGV